MPAASQTAEYRREPRSKTQCRATARVAVSVEIVDASARGVRVRMSLSLPIGTTMKIGLPGGTERHARIVWTDGDDVGCEFLAPLKVCELEQLLDATGIASPRRGVAGAADWAR